MVLGLVGAAPEGTSGQTVDRRAPDILVITNPDVPAQPDGMSVAEVRRIFMLRRQFWTAGLRIAPVNLPASDSLRDRFSRQFLGQPPRQLVDYWNDLYFHGLEPPPVVESQRAVVLYVARTSGAIGYVEEGSLDPALGDVRVVRVRR